MVKIKLVGCQFHPASKRCIENEVVRIIKDPNNKFDPEAIKVVNGLGEIIGFVGTQKTVSRGNRKNGCIDNHQLGNLMGKETRGIITKFKEYFGFIEVDL